MKKKSLLLLLGLAAAIAVSGCGNKNEKKQETEFTTDAPAATADEDVIEETAAETESLLDPITPSDYLVNNIDDYVTLGEISGLPVTQYTYKVTDDMIAERIDTELSAYSEEKEVDRQSKSGDIIYADITSTVQGDDDSEYTESTYITLGDEEYGAEFDEKMTGVSAGDTQEFSITFDDDIGDDDSEYTESTYITLGDEEYGAEFDEKMTGVSAGDTQEFSITFDDDIWMEEWMGQTVDFKVSVTSICEVKTPEYNDDFVAENLKIQNTKQLRSMKLSCAKKLKQRMPRQAIQMQSRSFIAALRKTLYSPIIPRICMIFVKKRFLHSTRHLPALQMRLISTKCSVLQRKM